MGYLWRRVGTEIVRVLCHWCLQGKVVFDKMDWEDGVEMRRQMMGYHVGGGYSFLMAQVGEDPCQNWSDGDYGHFAGSTLIDQ